MDINRTSRTGRGGHSGAQLLRVERRARDRRGWNRGRRRGGLAGDNPATPSLAVSKYLPSDHAACSPGLTGGVNAHGEAARLGSAILVSLTVTIMARPRCTRRGDGQGIQPELGAQECVTMYCSSASSNPTGRPRMSMRHGETEDPGQAEGTNGLGRLTAWVSLSLNLRVLPSRWRRAPGRRGVNRGRRLRTYALAAGPLTGGWCG